MPPVSLLNDMEFERKNCRIQSSRRKQRHYYSQENIAIFEEKPLPARSVVKYASTLTSLYSTMRGLSE
jgi:hypothetical protein